MLRKPKLLDEAALKEYALRLLGGRALSAGQLREKLRSKAERKEAVDAVLAQLKEYGYLDDRAFAETYANARLNNQGFGKQRVMRDLRQRRVSAGIAEQAVAKTFADSDEVALVEAFLARKYRGANLTELLADEKKLASVYRRLRYAGFSGSASAKVLGRHTSATFEED
ncbi:MAG TPA: RecX family transcriptional regulator [Solibacterales bacterium]|nr:RecX family transcriptional regulator [Bryobacterales bacterium]